MLPTLRMLLGLICIAFLNRHCYGYSSRQMPMFAEAACFRIAHVLSPASAVYYPGEPLYEKGVYHYAISSTQPSKCVVEAGTPSDVGKTLVILGKTRTPFAVKSGGHATNPGFSSTPDVHISLYRLSEVKYDPELQTATIGTGLIWDDVYAALEPFGVSVLGGRVTGIGVGGFILGGGYSWQTNQFGLAIDNVVGFELVQPNGQIVDVTKQSDPELFFGLKGGFNNFGIVTKFTLKTHPQGPVWGGSIYNLEVTMPAVKAATVAFQQTVTDPQASLIMTYNYVPSLEQIVVTQLMFYDGPVPPAGIFDAFIAIPAIQSDVTTQSFLSFIKASPANTTIGGRAVYQGFPIMSLTPTLSDIMLNESKFWGMALAEKSQVSLSYDIELFLPSIYSHTSDKSAYPPRRDIPFQPFNMAYTWNSSEFDTDFHAAAAASSEYIVKAAIGRVRLSSFMRPAIPTMLLLEHRWSRCMEPTYPLSAR
ncbi:FAD-binding domain-containing protein [Pholiota molesta]|nr:FAD-binding domain-containing protein [Pholiota molesta]